MQCLRAGALLMVLLLAGGHVLLLVVMHCSGCIGREADAQGTTSSSRRAAGGLASAVSRSTVSEQPWAKNLEAIELMAEVAPMHEAHASVHCFIAIQVGNADCMHQQL